MVAQHAWVVESKESDPDEPMYLVGTSAGRCFFIWTQDHTRSKKFSSEHEAHRFVKNSGSLSLLCEARIVKLFWG